MQKPSWKKHTRSPNWNRPSQIGAKFIAIKAFIFLHLAQSVLFSLIFHDDGTGENAEEYHYKIAQVVRPELFFDSFADSLFRYNKGILCRVH